MKEREKKSERKSSSNVEYMNETEWYQQTVTMTDCYFSFFLSSSSKHKYYDSWKLSRVFRFTRSNRLTDFILS